MGDRRVRSDVHEGRDQVVEDDECKALTGSEQLKLENETAENWRGQCRLCGLNLVGPLKAFQEHICAD